MKTIKKKYSSWDDHIKRRLKRATLSGGYLGKFVRVKQNSLTIVAFSRKQIMGWVFILSIERENMVSTFVNERYRNKGVVTQLIEQTLNVHPRIILCWWNNATKIFFRKLKKKHPGKIKIINWWENIEKYHEIVEALSR